MHKLSRSILAFCLAIVTIFASGCVAVTTLPAPTQTLSHHKHQQTSRHHFLQKRPLRLQLFRQSHHLQRQFLSLAGQYYSNMILKKIIGHQESIHIGSQQTVLTQNILAILIRVGTLLQTKMLTLGLRMQSLNLPIITFGQIGMDVMFFQVHFSRDKKAEFFWLRKIKPRTGKSSNNRVQNPRYHRWKNKVEVTSKRPNTKRLRVWR